MITKKKNKYKKITILAILAAVFISICGFSENDQRVYDYEDLYTEEQEQNLEQKLYETSKDLKCELAIVTVDDFDGKSSQDYADDFYDEHKFGTDFDETGFLLVINMNERELYISNAGEAPNYFTDDMIDEMVSSIGSYLADSDYIGAANWFISYVDKNMWEVNYNEGIMSNWVVQLFIAIVVSGIIVLVLAHGNKSKMTVGSATYMKDNKSKVLQKSDLFIRTTTVSQKIESSSNSGGGGSTHTSSSGSTHGGGGGKF